MRRLLWLAFMWMSVAAAPLLAQETTSGQVRFAHFSSDAGTISLRLGDAIMAEALTFSAISGWQAIPAGDYLAEIVAQDEIIFAIELTIEADRWQTLALVGSREAQTLLLQTVEDDLRDVANGEARVSFFHGVRGLGPVDVRLPDESALIQLLAYPGTVGDTDGFASIDIIADRYTFSLHNDESDEALLNFGELYISPGRYYLIAIIGTSRQPQFIVDSFEIPPRLQEPINPEMDFTGEAQVRFGHFSPQTSPIRIIFGETPLVDELAYPGVTAYQTVAAGEGPLLVQSGDDVLLTQPITLLPDGHYLIVAHGVLGDESFSLQVVHEGDAPPAQGEGRVSVFQAIRTDELFTLQANDNVLMQGLAYPQTFAGAGDGYASVDIVAGRYNLLLESASITIEIGTVAVDSGRHVLVISTGIPSAPLFVTTSTQFEGASSPQD